MRKWKYLLFFGVISLSLTGCNPNKSENGENTITEAASEVEESTLEENTDEGAETGDTDSATVKEAPFVKINSTYYELDDDEYWKYFTGSYETASVSGEGYEALTASIEDWFQNYENTYIENANKLYEDAKSYVEPDSEYNNASYLNSTVKTARADEKIVSFQIAEEEYAGGAHGNKFDFGLTFDAQTGKELIFSDLGDIKEDVKAYIKNSIAKDPEVMEGIIVDDYNTVVDETIDGEPAWYLTGNGLTIIFNEYELLSYAAGDYVVTIPYEELPSFNEKYINADSYFIPLKENTSVFTDIGNDGTQDEISLVCNYTDDYSYMTVDVNINGNKTTANDYCYNANGYYLHTKEGKDYILVCTGSDNDFVQTTLIGIENGIPVNLTSEGMDILAVSGDRLWTSRKVDMLGSYSGYCTIEMKDNAFNRVEDRYQYDTKKDIDWNYAITVTKELPCKLMIDGELKDSTLPAGTKISVCNSDGESVVGFETEDGTYGEIYQNTAEWPHTINGTDESEFFEMLPYAG